MELNDLIHDPVKKLPEFNPDLFIAGSGYESRATHIPSALNDPGKNKVVLGYSECRKELHRKENDHYFDERGYESFFVSGKSTPPYNTLFSKFTGEELNVLMDISVMPRIWYHALLKFIHLNADFKRLHLRLAYCPSLFFEPTPFRKKIGISTLDMLENSGRKKKGDREMMLMAGLGSERELVKIVVDKLKPGTTKLFYSDPAIHKSYVETVFVNNHELIGKTDIQNLVPYPLMDTAAIYKILLDEILPARNQNRVVIVPQGPKIFSLISMILQMNYPDIEIVYPHYSERQIRDKKPYSEHLFLDIIFGAE